MIELTQKGSVIFSGTDIWTVDMFHILEQVQAIAKGWA